MVCSSLTPITGHRDRVSLAGTTSHTRYGDNDSAVGHARRSICLNLRFTPQKYKRDCICAMASVDEMGLEDVADATRDIAAARDALDRALARRDDAIRQAFAEGSAIGAIAEAADLTPSRIGSILGHPHQRVGRPSAPVQDTD